MSSGTITTSLTATGPIRNTTPSKSIFAKSYSAAKIVLNNPLVKIGLSLLAGAAIGWLAAPYIAVAARAVFPAVYTFYAGSIPCMFNPSYYLVYIPAREHAVAAAYNYSSAVTSAIIGGVTAVGSLLTFVWHGVSSKHHQAPSDLKLSLARNN